MNNSAFVSGDTIKVAVGTYTGTGNEVVHLTQNVTISGGWDASFTIQTGLSTIDGQYARRGITAGSDVTAFLDHFDIRNGQSYDGGGVLNEGTLTIAFSQIDYNSAIYECGGIYNGGI